MKREIPPGLAIAVIVIALVVAGFFYVRHWFSGPKRISGTPPPGINLAPPPPGQSQMPMASPPPPGYGR
ncbi:MAG: hypothetical protein KatS3mg023_2537 [Armatimonadota bacterium]|jgi:hypothetical protein|nr:MAG: hypothetical protein KatS3mg023_2537 [Armatimonadota bacterium]